MASRNLFMILSLLSSILLFNVSFVTIADSKTTGSGWIPLSKNNPIGAQLATWAVSEYNKDSQTPLEFTRFISGASQTSSEGVKYKLNFYARNAQRTGIYGAMVLEDPSHIKHLLNFGQA